MRFNVIKNWTWRCCKHGTWTPHPLSTSVTGKNRLHINSPNIKKLYLPFLSLAVPLSLSLSPALKFEQREISAMASSTNVRENFVYVAKLAEQAERYDGFLSLFLSLYMKFWTVFMVLHFTCFQFSIMFSPTFTLTHFLFLTYYILSFHKVSIFFKKKFTFFLFASLTHYKSVGMLK